jgi:formate dehydrogenase alpha subunit
MSRLVTLTIDGREVSVPEGATVLEAAAKLGIEIPHLCHCPGLKSTGACRLCLVEIENVRAPVVSCKYKVKPGQVVWTETEAIRKHRRFIIELLLSRHPGACLGCEKSGTCKLQQYAYELDVEKPGFPVRDPGYPIANTDPFIERNDNLCVLCGRCIRVCELQGSAVLSFVERGVTMRVSTPLNRTLQEAGCDFCGSCVSVCPTAALLEKRSKGRGRPVDMQKVEVVCGYCAAACSLQFNLNKKGEIARVSTRDPVDYLCARGRFGWEYLTSSERLTTPLVKKDGELVPAEWDEALDLVAHKLKELRAEHGPAAIGGIIGGLCSNEVAYAFQKLMRVGLKTNNVDSSLRPAGFTLWQDMEERCGPGGWASLDDISSAGVLVVIGDVVRRMPVLWGKIRRARERGAVLIVIDFRAGRFTREAQVWLRAEPGAEALVLAQMAAMLWAGRRCDEAGLKREFENFEDYTGALEAVSSCDVSGVGREELEAACAAYGDAAKKAVIIFAVDGISPGAGRMAVNLAMLTGRRKKGIFPAFSTVNIRGVVRMGAAPEYLAGLRRVPGGHDESEWPADPGLTAAAMMEKGSPVRGLYILGENPAVSFPGSAEVRARLEELEFLVVQDLFLTETARLADVVLPSVTLAEDEGSIIDAGGRRREFNRAIEPRTRTDRETIAAIASRIDPELAPAFGPNIQEEVRALVLGDEADARGLQPAFFIPPSDYTRPAAGQNEGAFTLVPYADRFGFYDIARLRHTKLPVLQPYEGDYLSISPQDGEKLEITEGTAVAVTTERQKIITTARIDPSLPQGVVTIPAHSAAAHVLVSTDDPTAPVAVKIAKV